jgi:hypothetical protein
MVSGQLHVPASLPLEKDPLVPSGEKTIGGHLGQYEQRVKQKNFCLHRESNPSYSAVQLTA